MTRNQGPVSKKTDWEACRTTPAKKLSKTDFIALFYDPNIVSAQDIEFLLWGGDAVHINKKPPRGSLAITRHHGVGDVSG